MYMYMHMYTYMYMYMHMYMYILMYLYMYRTGENRSVRFFFSLQVSLARPAALYQNLCFDRVFMSLLWHLCAKRHIHANRKLQY